MNFGGTEHLIGRITIDVPGIALQARPSLVRNFTALFYSVPPAGANVKLVVFDLAGRAVRTLVHGFQSGGNHYEVWDRTDDRGHTTRAGVFFVRLIAGDTRDVRRLIVVP